MDILVVASELAPYARVGSVSDVVAALSKTLRQHGHNVTLALPRYPHFERAGLLVARRLNALTFPMGSSQITATVYDGRLPSGVELTLLDVPGFADREGIYGETPQDYADNPQRFATFCRAAVELARQRAKAGNAFDAVHSHDWPCALVPLYSRRVLDPSEAPWRNVFTVHNLAHQGVVDPGLLDALSIPRDLFNPEGVEFYGRVNILKAGLVFADAITTISRSYAVEIRTAEGGRGLDGVLKSRAKVLSGIVNGIDYSLWNPATDPHIAARFDAQDAGHKSLCKNALLSELPLDMTPARPLVAFHGRLVERKGIDLLLQSLTRLFRSDVAVVVAGHAEQEVAANLAAAQEKFAGRFAFVSAPSDPLVHRIVAAADMVVVPSKFEPCGVAQLQGQRYGAVPIAHATGSLLDTIVDCDASLTTGTGFLFDEPTADGLISALQRALAVFPTPAWGRLRSRVMRLESSWDRPAHQYAQLYRAGIKQGA